MISEVAWNLVLRDRERARVELSYGQANKYNPPEVGVVLRVCGHELSVYMALGSWRTAGIFDYGYCVEGDSYAKHVPRRGWRKGGG